MIEYKYSLDNSSKKFICPNCNKKTFVRFVDTVKGEYLPTDFGRCDREQNCQYYKAPPKGKKAFLIDFIALKEISNKAFKLVDKNGLISIVPKSQILEQKENSCFISEWYLQNSKINYLNKESKYFNPDVKPFFNVLKTVVKPQQKTPSFHSLKLQDTIIKEYNKKDEVCNLTYYLLNHFDFETVKKAVSNYYLTGSNYCWNNSTIFWQIDTNQQIRGAKIMLYDKNTGKRIKEPYNHINWLHNALKVPDFNLCQCLFGLHLIKEDYTKKIGIVESEKTAIIMSMFLPQYIWVATGSKSNFNERFLTPIKKRTCISFPDKGEFNNWSKKANELNKKGFKIQVSNLLEQTNFENGFDLADYYFL